MIGVHLHDCVGIEDHCAPSQGEIDFAMLKPYIRKETLMVIEAHSPVTGSDLKKSREFLKSIFDGRS
jgi:sugar phosphate isomerase/epimerase